MAYYVYKNRNNGVISVGESPDPIKAVRSSWSLVTGGGLSASDVVAAIAAYETRKAADATALATRQAADRSALGIGADGGAATGVISMAELGITTSAAAQAVINAAATGTLIEFSSTTTIAVSGAPVLLPDRLSYRFVGPPMRAHFRPADTATGLKAVVCSTGWAANATAPIYTGNPISLMGLIIDGNKANIAGASPACQGLVVMNWQTKVVDPIIYDTVLSGIVMADSDSAGTALSNTSVEPRIIGAKILNPDAYGIEVQDVAHSVTDGWLIDTIVSGAKLTNIRVRRSAGWQISGVHSYTGGGRGLSAVHCSAGYGTIINKIYVDYYGQDTVGGGIYSGVRLDQLTGRGSIISDVTIAAPAGLVSGSTYHHVHVEAGAGQVADVTVANVQIHGQGIASETAVYYTAPSGAVLNIDEGLIRTKWVTPGVATDRTHAGSGTVNVNKIVTGALNATTGAITVPGILAAKTLAPTGLTGATAGGGEWVGTTVSGAPTTGTFAVGQWVTDRAGVRWTCTVAGTPGTWVASGSGSATSSPAQTGLAGTGMIPIVTNNTVYPNPGTGNAGQGADGGTMARLQHVVSNDAREIRLVYGNGYVQQNIPGEVAGANDIIVRASVEYPSGPWKFTSGSTAWSGATAYVVGDQVTYSGGSYVSIQAGTNQTPSAGGTAYWAVVQTYPVHFAGESAARDVTIRPGEIILSEPIGIDLAAGTKLFTNTLCQPNNGTANTGYYPLGQTALSTTTTSGPDWVGSATAGSAPTDYTTTAPTAAVSVTTRNVYGPMAVIGAPVGGIGSVVSAAAIGDSIVAGSGDGMQGNEQGGWYIRARNLVGNLSSIRMAKSGDKALFATGVGARVRRVMWGGATHIICEYGTNDIGAGPDLATIQARLVGQWSSASGRGAKVWQTTITPQTDDGTGTPWTTVGAQTARTNFGPSSIWSNLNAWLRDGAPLDSTTKVAAATGSSSGVVRMGSVGHYLTGIIDLAAVVCDTTVTWAWKAGYTADGTHPNSATHGLMATAAAAVMSGWTAPGGPVTGPQGPQGTAGATGLTGPAGGYTTVQNAAGTGVTARDTLQFTGSGVTSVADSGGTKTVVTIAGGGYSTVQDAAGTGVTARSTLQFTGSGVTSVADSGGTKTVVTLSGSTASFGSGGDGSDGDCALDGSNTFAFMSKSGNVYTLTRDVLAQNVTISNGVTLKTAGYKLYCSATFTNNTGGIVSHNGGDAAGATAGALAAAASLRGGVAGAAGGTGVGSAGSAQTSNAYGGAGGAGGAGTSGAGGAGGAITAANAFGGGVLLARIMPHAAVGYGISAGSLQSFNPGAGGGSGAGDGTNAGGGGGGGAGQMLINAKTFINNGTITANGGAGAAGVAGNAGGGGGGGGGLVVVNTTASSGSGTVTAAGGTAGAGSGTGSTGTAGSAGRAIVNVW